MILNNPLSLEQVKSLHGKQRDVMSGTLSTFNNVMYGASLLNLCLIVLYVFAAYRYTLHISAFWGTVVAAVICIFSVPLRPKRNLERTLYKRAVPVYSFCVWTLCVISVIPVTDNNLILLFLVLACAFLYRSLIFNLLNHTFLEYEYEKDKGGLIYTLRPDSEMLLRIEALAKTNKDIDHYLKTIRGYDRELMLFEAVEIIAAHESEVEGKPSIGYGYMDLDEETLRALSDAEKIKPLTHAELKLVAEHIITRNKIADDGADEIRRIGYEAMANSMQSEVRAAPSLEEALLAAAQYVTINFSPENLVVPKRFRMSDGAERLDLAQEYIDANPGYDVFENSMQIRI